MLISPLHLALFRENWRFFRNFWTFFGCHFWLFIECPALKCENTFLTLDCAIFLSFFQIFIESIYIFFSELAFGVSLVIIDVGTNAGISKLVPALGGRPFGQSSLINNFGFAIVTVLRSFIWLLTVISLKISNSLILRRFLSYLLNKILPCNFFILLEVIIFHVLKGWNWAKILYFIILTESASFFLDSNVLILGSFQAVKVR